MGVTYTSEYLIFGLIVVDTEDIAVEVVESDDQEQDVRYVSLVRD